MVTCKIVGSNPAALALSRFLVSEGFRVHLASAGPGRISRFHDTFFRNSNPLGRDGLHLARLAGLGDSEVVFADISASSKVYLGQEQLTLFPKFYDAVRYALPCTTEWLWPRGTKADESVADFLGRRFPRRTAKKLGASLASVFAAGAADQVSAASALPRLFYAEKQSRSLLFRPLMNSLIRSSRKSVVSESLRQRAATGGRLWTVRGGVEALVQSLSADLRSHPEFSDQPIDNSDLLVYTSPEALARDRPELKTQFPCLFATRQVTTVTLRFARNSLATKIKRSAGFWRPADAGVIGGWFHFWLFPEISSDEDQVTVFLTGRVDPTEAADGAQKFLLDHFRVSTVPAEVVVETEEVPAFPVGHASQLEEFNKWRTREAPQMQVCGPGFYAAAITDVISDCKDLSMQLRERYEKFPFIENELQSDWGRRGGFMLGRQTERIPRSRISL